METPEAVGSVARVATQALSDAVHVLWHGHGRNVEQGTTRRHLRPVQGVATMNVIFQDIDGVLNSEQFALDRERRRLAAKARGEEPALQDLLFEHNIDAACVERLNQIIAATDARLVISSTWRKLLSLDEIHRILTLHGFRGEIIGATPDAFKDRSMLDDAAKKFGGYIDSEGYARPYVGTRARWAQRGHEIATWLQRNNRLLSSAPCTAFIIIDDDRDMAHLVDRHIHTSATDGLTDSDVERAIKLMATPWVAPAPGDPL